MNPFKKAWQFLKADDDVPVYDPHKQETYDVGAASCANCDVGNLDEQVECTNCGDKWCPDCYDNLSEEWMHYGEEGYPGEDWGDICPKCKKAIWGGDA